MKEPRTPIPWTPSIVLRLPAAGDVDFAVRAVNNHAKLLVALERLADTMSDYPLGRATGSDVADAIGDARDVIEEAKKGS